jgi:hypothetical protein
VAEAGIRPATLDALWQVSQVLLDGMCEVAPIGLVGGMPMILVMPAKLVPVPLVAWQETQLVVMPLWLIREPLNLAPLPTGRVLMLEPVPTWQLSQETLVGIWLLGNPTMLKLAAGMAKLGAALPWHCAQLVVVLGA